MPTANLTSAVGFRAADEGSVDRAYGLGGVGGLQHPGAHGDAPGAHAGQGVDVRGRDAADGEDGQLAGVGEAAADQCGPAGRAFERLAGAREARTEARVIRASTVGASHLTLVVSRRADQEVRAQDAAGLFGWHVGLTDVYAVRTRLPNQVHTIVEHQEGARSCDEGPDRGGAVKHLPVVAVLLPDLHHTHEPGVERALQGVEPGGSVRIRRDDEVDDRLRQAFAAREGRGHARSVRWSRAGAALLRVAGATSSLAPWPYAGGVVRRLPPAAAPVSFGPTWPLMGAIVGTYVIAQLCVGQVFVVMLPMTREDAQTWLEGRADLLMMGVVGIAAVLWLLAVARRWASPATGAGLLLAAVGVTGRFVTRYAVDARLGFLWPAGTEQAEGLSALGAMTDAIGLVAFAFGLASVAAGVWSERRLRREAPPWLLTLE